MPHILQIMAKGVVKGLDQTLKNLRKLGVDVEEEIAQITEDTAREIAADAKVRAPKNFGDLAQSINYTQVADSHYRVVVGVNYAPYVEFGTGKRVSVPPELSEYAMQFKGNGSGGTYADGLLAFYDWAAAKGLEEWEADQIFYFIFINGIWPQPFLYPAFVQGRIKYLIELSKMLKRLVK